MVIVDVSECQSTRIDHNRPPNVVIQHVITRVDPSPDFTKNADHSPQLDGHNASGIYLMSIMKCCLQMI